MEICGTLVKNLPHGAFVTFSVSRAKPCPQDICASDIELEDFDQEEARRRANPTAKTPSARMGT